MSILKHIIYFPLWPFKVYNDSHWIGAGIMDIEAVINSTVHYQEIFQLLSLLQLTYYLFPKQAEVFDEQCFDYVIIGGGTAGCVLANRLTEDPNTSVLLIEAGGNPPIEVQNPGLLDYLLHSRLDWNFTTEPDKNFQQCHKNNVGYLSSGKVLGGSTSLSLTNYYIRGPSYDYDDWAKLVNDSNWDWNHTLPYFIKSEKLADCDLLSSSCAEYYGKDGPFGVTKESRNEIHKYLNSFKELNYPTPLDINGCTSEGYAPAMYTVMNGIRQNTAYSYLSSIKDRSNLHVLKNALAEEILFDSRNNAVGVKFSITGNKTMRVYARIEVILSAGSINSPKLLMTSGIGPKEHLMELKIPVRSDLPVGFNYQNHLFVLLIIKMENSNTTKEPINPEQFPDPSFTGYVRLNQSQSYDDYLSVNTLIPHDSPDFLLNCAFIYGFENKICQDIYDDARGRNIMLTNIIPLHPKSRGRITLRSRNFTDPPLIQAGILQDGRDFDNLVAFLKDYLRVLNTTYFRSVNAEISVSKQIKCSEYDLWSSDYLYCYARCMVSTLQHYVGTCSMGPVVDTQLRVRGVKRLRVVDGSVIPKIIGSCIGIPVIMMAEKAADIIKTTPPDGIEDYFELQKND